jgi:membrane protein involved in colicin uptake
MQGIQATAKAQAEKAEAMAKAQAEKAEAQFQAEKSAFQVGIGCLVED